MVGRTLCSWRKIIREKLDELGYTVESGLEDFIPLWKYIVEADDEMELRLPPVVVLNNKRIIMTNQSPDIIRKRK